MSRTPNVTVSAILDTCVCLCRCLVGGELRHCAVTSHITILLLLLFLHLLLHLLLLLRMLKNNLYPQSVPEIHAACCWHANSFLTKYLQLSYLPCIVRLESGRSRVQNPACARIFSGSSHTSDFKIGTPVATLPGAWRQRVSTGTGGPCVSIL